MAKIKTAALTLSAISSLVDEDVIGRRWDEDQLESAGYYFDEQITIIKLTKKSNPDNYRSDELDLSDFWVVAIVESGMSGDETSASIESAAASLEIPNRTATPAPALASKRIPPPHSTNLEAIPTILSHSAPVDSSKRTSTPPSTDLETIPTTLSNPGTATPLHSTSPPPSSDPNPTSSTQAEREVIDLSAGSEYQLRGQ